MSDKGWLKLKDGGLDRKELKVGKQQHQNQLLICNYQLRDVV